MKKHVLIPLCRPLAVVLAALTLLLGAGCEATPDGQPAAAAPAGTPTRVTNPRPVIVRDFAFDQAQLRVEPGPLSGREGPAKRILGNLHPQEAPAQKAGRLAALLSETIANELADRKIPARRESVVSPLPADGLMVSGQFMQVDEGNRLKRAVVGFGAGATEVLVQVAVYDLVQSRDQPVLVYGTGTGSKPAPGALVTLNPYAMAARYVLSRNATDKDVRRLGKRIASDLVQLEAGAGVKR
jgi:hypothetical protein